MSIQVLDQNTINKIAAGEVIERPSSVVKELVENAIDAKATAITIEIKDGGISFVRITDNGCGIPHEELPLAFLRHSTSKIRSVEDLLHVSSLGFRGEALSSIAAVAQVELITKTQDSFSGYRYIIEGGEEKSLEEVGAPDGTTFIVRNLFYNTPVRRKFLKTAMTEAGYISSLIEHLSLSHPDISFRFINNNQNKLHTSGNMNLKDIIYNVYGRDITHNLVEINAKTQDVKMTGFIGKPMICRGNRTYENYYINGRFIKSGIITKAIEEAYKGYIMPHNYPFTAIHFEINPAILDVNVHPTKMELRFSKNEFVHHFVLETVKNALNRRELVPEVHIDNRREQPKVQAVTSTQSVSNKSNVSNNSNVSNVSKEPYRAPAMKPLPAATQIQPVSRSTESAHQNASGQTGNRPGSWHENKSYKYTADQKDSNIATTSNIAGAESPKSIAKETVNNAMNDAKSEVVNDAVQEKNAQQTIDHKTRLPEPFELKRSEQMVKEDNEALAYGKEQERKAEQLNLFEDKLLDAKQSPQYRIIGQLFETYWLIEFEDKFYMMDQHAAHEKILYEKMMRHLKEKDLDTQMILPPVILSLNMREEEVLKEHFDIFHKVGYEIEEFGGNEYKVTGMPAGLPRLDCKQLLIDMIDGMVEEGTSKDPEMITEKVASMSCKAAVKGNNKLSMQEAKELMDELMQAENPYNCPHGRPTLVMMTKYEIEKKFKRII